MTPQEYYAAILDTYIPTQMHDDVTNRFFQTTLTDSEDFPTHKKILHVDKLQIILMEFWNEMQEIWGKSTAYSYTNGKLKTKVGKLPNESWGTGGHGVFSGTFENPQNFGERVTTAYLSGYAEIDEYGVYTAPGDEENHAKTMTALVEVERLKRSARIDLAEALAKAREAAKNAPRNSPIRIGAITTIKNAARSTSSLATAAMLQQAANPQKVKTNTDQARKLRLNACVAYFEYLMAKTHLLIFEKDYHLENALISGDDPQNYRKYRSTK